MGDYNPNKPVVIGNEMTGIRNVDLRPTIAAEYSSGLTLSASTQIGQARFSVAKMNSFSDNRIVYVVSAYPNGTMGDSGPIQSAIIPVTNVAVTGGTSAPDTAGDYVAAVYDPNQGRISMTGSAGFPNAWPLTAAWMRFNVTPYAFLASKRILEVNVLASVSLSEDIDPSSNSPFDPYVGFINSASPGTILGGSANMSNLFPIINGETVDRPINFSAYPVHRLRTGSVVPNPMSATSLAAGENVPWNYSDLLQIGAAGSWYFAILFGPSFFGFGATNNAMVTYVALEVVYCDELRLAVGAYNPGDVSINRGWFTQVVPMRAWPAKTVSPILAAGTYDLSITRGDQGYFSNANPNDPGINAYRYLDLVPPFDGNTLQIPGDLPGAIGTELVSVESTVLPQLTLHATGGPVVADSQGYGQSIAPHVYGANFALQVLRDPTASGLSYTWLRFYARHYAGTVVPLSVDWLGTVLDTFTPEEIDAFPLVADNWHEVVTPIPAITVAPSGTINFTATAASAANRWEVLGVAAPALTGLTGSLLTPATGQLDNTTYDGTTSFLTWMPNGVTAGYNAAPSPSFASDASVILGVAPATPTGFGVAARVQPLLGIGLECLDTPCGIADSLYYNRLTWSQPPNTTSAFDTFTRTVAPGGWGTADTGQTYTITELGGGSLSAAHYSVTPTTGGHIDLTVNFSDSVAVINVGATDQDVTMLVDPVNVDTSADNGYGIVFRATNADNCWLFRYRPMTSTLILAARVGGVTLVAISAGINIPMVRSYFRAQAQGPVIRCKIWPEWMDEPDEWDILYTDTAGIVPGSGVGSEIRKASNIVSFPNMVVNFDNLVVRAPDVNFGFYELQREDIVTDWQTIMAATSTMATGFNDYEARPGLESVYRIRSVTDQGFYGAWSPEVRITMASPGASGGPCFGQGHVLLFTSNEAQDGSRNLAYSSAWTSDKTEETFDFPESQTVQLQAMYGKNFYTAFHTTERGGEQFQRNVLVQAAAISPETLADFVDLRDMAWADLPYVCVRDEDGNRWFALVTVNEGRVQLNRSIYLASIGVTEVTDTASPVDP